MIASSARVRQDEAELAKAPDERRCALMASKILSRFIPGSRVGGSSGRGGDGFEGGVMAPLREVMTRYLTGASG